MLGRPVSTGEFRRINLIGGAISLLAAALPPLAVWAPPGCLSGAFALRGLLSSAARR